MSQAASSNLAVRATPLARLHPLAGFLAVVLSMVLMSPVADAQEISASEPLTVAYRLIIEPAYNRARGPANLFALRLHAAI